MATFTAHEKDRIVFETTADERVPGLLLLIHGAVFAGAPLYAVAQYGLKGASACLLVGAVVLLGLGEIAFSLILLLRSESLVIDLLRRCYSGRRGVWLWGEKWAGPIDDFDHIRLIEVPCGRHGRHRRLVVEWVWADEQRPPFRVSSWGGYHSFRLARGSQGSDGREFLRDLRTIAEDVGIPMLLPEPYLGGLGISDQQLRWFGYRGGDEPDE